MMNCTIRILGLGLLASLAVAGVAQAADRATVNRHTGLFELPTTDLRKASERGDRAELARVAARMGPARVARALQDADRRTVLAGLDAVPLLSSGILLLEGILPLLTASDETIRSHAVAAAAALLAASDGVSLADWEVAGETAQSTCQALALLAAKEAEPMAARLLAIQGLADAPALCATARKPAELLASRQPEIRRAAVLGLLPSTAPIAALIAAAQDHDSGVAAAAGARLCERLGKNQTLPKVSAPSAVPTLGRLALAGGVLPEDIIGMLPCLAASADPVDRKAIEELQASGTTAVREAIQRLQEKAGSR